MVLEVDILIEIIKKMAFGIKVAQMLFIKKELKVF